MPHAPASTATDPWVPTGQAIDRRFRAATQDAEAPPGRPKLGPVVPVPMRNTASAKAGVGSSFASDVLLARSANRRHGRSQALRRIPCLPRKAGKSLPISSWNY